MIEYTFEQFLKNYNSSKMYAYLREGSGVCLVTEDLQRGYQVEVILVDSSLENHKIFPVYSNTYESKIEYIKKLAAPCKEKIYEVEEAEDIIRLIMMRELIS